MGFRGQSFPEHASNGSRLEGGREGTLLRGIFSPPKFLSILSHSGRRHIRSYFALLTKQGIGDACLAVLSPAFSRSEILWNFRNVMNFSFRILLTRRVAIIVISLFSFWRDIDEERRIYAEIIFFNHNLKCRFPKRFSWYVCI